MVPGNYIRYIYRYIYIYIYIYRITNVYMNAMNGSIICCYILIVYTENCVDDTQHVYCYLFANQNCQPDPRALCKHKFSLLSLE